MKDPWIFEQAAGAQNGAVVCGIDEAGRGPLAGDVYAAAVILPYGIELAGLNDSKKLTPKKRDELYDKICETAVAYSIKSADVGEIEALNILGATMLAMRRAVEGLGVTPDVALVDGNKSTGLPVKANCITGGDGKSASIAAASILAKVSRDRYMREMSVIYPQYGFEKHKGYGTKDHIQAIVKYGLCPLHRSLFVRGIGL